MFTHSIRFVLAKDVLYFNLSQKSTNNDVDFGLCEFGAVVYRPYLSIALPRIGTAGV
jgi:hypothetical protein